MQRHCIEIGLIELEAEAPVEGVGADSLRIACQMQFRAAKTPCLIYKSQHQRLALMRELSPTSGCSEKQLRSAMEDDGIHIFIIREDGIIVATATLCVNHTPEFTVGSVGS